MNSISHSKIIKRAFTAITISWLMLATFPTYSAAQLAPVVGKSFAAPNVVINNRTTMTITIQNPAVNAVALTSVAFTDNYPSGITGTTTANAITPAGCTGTLTANLGSFVLTGGAVPINTTCNYSVLVTGSAVGAHLNATGPVTSNEAPNGASASATLNVYDRPTVTKTFTPGTTVSGATSSMVITVTNPAGNPGNITGVTIDDPYTAGTISNNAAGALVCSGAGSATLTGGVNGGTSVGFSNGVIEPGGTCRITQSVMAQTVTATTIDTNSTTAPSATGPVALTAGSGASATLTVGPITAPAITKNFGTGNVVLGGGKTMSISVGETTDSVALTNVSFTDTYPAGITGALTATISTFSTGVKAGGTPPGTCTGTLTANAGSLVLTGGTVPINTRCNYSVVVTGNTAGPHLNATGPVTSDNAPAGASASATLNVYAKPTVTKIFTPNSIVSGGTSSMVITVTSPAGNPWNLTGVTIDDTYTGTLTNNAAGALVCSGAGSATLTGGVNGGTSVGFNNGVIEPGGTCTITQSVTATTTNNNSTTAPTATAASTGTMPLALTGTAASATLTATPSLPSINMVKSSTVFSDPSNGTLSPKRIPGAVVTYSIVTTNTGPGSVDTDTTILNDPIPTNTDMVVTDFGAVGSGPIQFIDGSPTSGLTGTFDLKFFTDAVCTVPLVGAPVADANGVDPNIRCVSVNLKGPFAADTDTVPPSPNFTINFRVRIR